MARAGYTWDDVGGRLPFTQFVQMMVYTAPTSAVYYAMHKGWTRETHKLADLIDIASWIAWTKTEDAQHNRNQPQPQWRPGDPVPNQQPVTTIRDYMKLVGMPGADDD